MAKGPENKFRDKYVRPMLDELGAYYFIKEERTLRGIPDIIGCLNGTFIALEVKASEKEANKRSGRVILQRLVIHSMERAGGFARFIYPENLKDIKEELANLASTQKD